MIAAGEDLLVCGCMRPIRADAQFHCHINSVRGHAQAPPPLAAGLCPPLDYARGCRCLVGSGLVWSDLVWSGLVWSALRCSGLAVPCLALSRCVSPRCVALRCVSANACGRVGVASCRFQRYALPLNCGLIECPEALDDDDDDEDEEQEE